MSEPIFALATPMAPAALAVVRTAGDRCIDIVAGLTDRAAAIRNSHGGRLRRATLLDPATGAAVDDVMLGIYRAPASYTGEDAVEIFCHGSLPGIQRILDLLRKAGLRDADPGEFTERAFIAGKLDLTRAEAVNEVVNAHTRAAQQLALSRLSGSVAQEIDAAKGDLATLMAHFTVQLDYPEDEIGPLPLPVERIEALRSRLAGLAATYRTGALFRDGVRIALAGRTNAGKSSLFNALLREDRAIVSATPGTTRDVLEARLDLDGIPVRVFDTAGVRETDESIESEGIRRAGSVRESADLVLYLVDGAAGVDAIDRSTLKQLGSKAIGVWTKVDLELAGPAPTDFVAVSTTAGPGVRGLVAAIKDRIAATGVAVDAAEHGGVIVDSARQRDLLLRAVDSLQSLTAGIAAQVTVDALSLDLQDALGALGEITGEVSSADILNQVFSNFCVGK